MKKGDINWLLILLTFVAILAIPSTRKVFISVTDAYPYAVGFIKFAILATMGELLGARVVNNEWKMPKGVFYKAIIWGIIGMMITLVFTVYMGGVAVAQASGKLPFEGIALAQAFFGSLIMNFTFAPAMFIFHKFTDLYIENKMEKNGGKVMLSALVDQVDWHLLVEFSILKTAPFFWVPAHTLVFLLPLQYRVAASAFLSIALGLLLALAKKGKPKPALQ
ncbi:MAG: hypothetical protein H6Q13_3262 [Bacteroidetes bacterium]|nr:hypothetical protein [Bacteroidota bacterium]